MFGLAPLNYWESFNFVKYGEDQHFQVHSDHGYSYICVLSSVGYINDDYEGGEISFTIKSPDAPISDGGKKFDRPISYGGPDPDMDIAKNNPESFTFFVKPKAGSVIVFPPSPPYHHTANLVKSGEKIMVPQHWVH